jgi:hypothetical protein
MPDNSMIKKVYEWSPALTRSLGRPKNRWQDDVKSDITNMKITIGRTASKTVPNGKNSLGRPKLL